MARRKLILLGGGDFARELAWFARLVPPEQRDWELHGCLDDRVTDTIGRPGSVRVPVVGTIAQHQPRSDEVFVCAIGNPSAKLAVTARIAERGGAFVNLVHPTACVGPGTSLGVGVVLAGGVTLSVDVTLGDHVAMNFNSTAGHDAVIGDGCTVSSFCDVTGNARLGRGVFLGSHASILPGAEVGDLATVGAGSVVLRRVAAGRSVIGVPAKSFL